MSVMVEGQDTVHGNWFSTDPPTSLGTFSSRPKQAHLVQYSPNTFGFMVVMDNGMREYYAPVKGTFTAVLVCPNDGSFEMTADDSGNQFPPIRNVNSKEVVTTFKFNGASYE
jgi:hypothetical protein